MTSVKKSVISEFGKILSSYHEKILNFMGWYGDDVHLFYSRISEVENLLDNLTVDDIDPNIKPPDSILKTSDLIQSIKYGNNKYPMPALLVKSVCGRLSNPLY